MDQHTLDDLTTLNYGAFDELPELGNDPRTTGVTVNSSTGAEDYHARNGFTKQQQELPFPLWNGILATLLHQLPFVICEPGFTTQKLCDFLAQADAMPDITQLPEPLECNVHYLHFLQDRALRAQSHTAYHLLCCGMDTSLAEVLRATPWDMLHAFATTYRTPMYKLQGPLNIEIPRTKYQFLPALLFMQRSVIGHEGNVAISSQVKQTVNPSGSENNATTSPRPEQEAEQKSNLAWYCRQTQEPLFIPVSKSSDIQHHSDCVKLAGRIVQENVLRPSLVKNLFLGILTENEIDEIYDRALPDKKWESGGHKRHLIQYFTKGGKQPPVELYFCHQLFMSIAEQLWTLSGKKGHKAWVYYNALHYYRTLQEACHKNSKESCLWNIDPRNALTMVGYLMGGDAITGKVCPKCGSRVFADMKVLTFCCPTCRLMDLAKKIIRSSHMAVEAKRRKNAAKVLQMQKDSQAAVANLVAQPLMFPSDFKLKLAPSETNHAPPPGLPELSLFGSMESARAA
jgi:endogenous inhibitor of DNA gyrase (YacG/DUF329 family)